jgi:type I restriction enzyme M protein
MRVSPCGFAAKTLEEAIAMADAVTVVTHNHPEGIKGAEATAAAIFLARSGKSKEEIREHIVQNYYPLCFTLDEIRPGYTFDVTCQGSVPQALEAFFESESFEDAIRNAISIGGDSDTIAAITGGVAEAYYGVPEEIRDMALSYLDDTEMEILIAFSEKYMG